MAASAAGCGQELVRRCGVLGPGGYGQAALVSPEGVRVVTALPGECKPLTGPCADPGLNPTQTKPT